MLENEAQRLPSTRLRRFLPVGCNSNNISSNNNSDKSLFGSHVLKALDPDLSSYSSTMGHLTM
jgi:hypothetical protein